MTNPEARAKALELALALQATKVSSGEEVTAAHLWGIVTLFETYIVTGVQPNGEKAT